MTTLDAYLYTVFEFAALHQEVRRLIWPISPTWIAGASDQLIGLVVISLFVGSVTAGIFVNYLNFRFYGSTDSKSNGSTAKLYATGAIIFASLISTVIFVLTWRATGIAEALASTLPGLTIFTLFAWLVRVRK